MILCLDRKIFSIRLIQHIRENKGYFKLGHNNYLKEKHCLACSGIDLRLWLLANIHFVAFSIRTDACRALQPVRWQLILLQFLMRIYPIVKSVIEPLSMDHFYPIPIRGRAFILHPASILSTGPAIWGFPLIRNLHTILGITRAFSITATTARGVQFAQRFQ